MTDYCLGCGEGITIGNKCMNCEKAPFCNDCSEKHPSMGRVCNNCKKEKNLGCIHCQNFSIRSCPSCRSLKEKGRIDRITQTCEDHITREFREEHEDFQKCFICKNCGGEVCLKCVVSKGIFFKDYFCKYCENDLETEKYPWEE